jgi:tRNA dimethylallyltransferase
MTSAPRPGNPQGAAARHAVIVAGPTASGKSALALALAQRLAGTIINADSMQTYAELRILTARPSDADLAAAPHALYGLNRAGAPGNAAWWRGAALREMESAASAGCLPILCGGTGLYFAALTGGIADIPDPGAEARDEARSLLAAIGPAALHARLAEADPQTASKLRPSDSQRLARAWEVWRGTGRGLASWQADPPPPPGDWRFTAILLDPPRADLTEAIETRFAAMLEAGALTEVQALLAQNLPPALPVMRAHGVPELSAYLRGETTLGEASARAVTVTRQYTRRQATWFRHHTLAPETRTRRIQSRIATTEQLSTDFLADLEHFILRSH